MTDRRNFDVVKAKLNQLDSLCQQFHEAHNLYCDELATLEEKENASHYVNDKESDIFKYRKEVTNWILECEARISDHLDRLSDKRSARSRSSRSSSSFMMLVTLLTVGSYERKSQSCQVNGRTLHVRGKNQIASC